MRHLICKSQDLIRQNIGSSSDLTLHPHTLFLIRYQALASPVNRSNEHSWPTAMGTVSDGFAAFNLPDESYLKTS